MINIIIGRMAALLLCTVEKKRYDKIECKMQ